MAPNLNQIAIKRNIIASLYQIRDSNPKINPENSARQASKNAINPKHPIIPLAFINIWALFILLLSISLYDIYTLILRAYRTYDTISYKLIFTTPYWCSLFIFPPHVRNWFNDSVTSSGLNVFECQG